MVVSRRLSPRRFAVECNLPVIVLGGGGVVNVVNALV
jgi:hypothetical protein